MILDHMPEGARLVVEGPASLDAEILGHGHLHALYLGAVPERLEDGVGKTKEQHVVHRALAQVVIDAEDPRLVEGAKKNLVELARGSEVRPERLLHDHPRV